MFSIAYKRVETLLDWRFLRPVAPSRNGGCDLADVLALHPGRSLQYHNAVPLWVPHARTLAHPILCSNSGHDAGVYTHTHREREGGLGFDVRELTMQPHPPCERTGASGAASVHNLAPKCLEHATDVWMCEY